jgi:hypothetical protein
MKRQEGGMKKTMHSISRASTPLQVGFPFSEIEKWFALGNRTSPLTGEALPSTNLFPNIALRTVIRENALL